MLAQPVVPWFRHRAMGLPTAQHLLSMNFPISSGEEKIAAARSPSIPAGMIAGAPLSGPPLLESVIKRKLCSQNARFAVGCGDAIRAVAIGNRPDAFATPRVFW